MNKADKQALLAVGGLALLYWLLSPKHGKCPQCNYPVTSKNARCPNCNLQLNWEKFK